MNLIDADIYEIIFRRNGREVEIEEIPTDYLNGIIKACRDEIMSREQLKRVFGRMSNEQFRKAIRCPECDTLIVDDGYTLDLTTPDRVMDLSLFCDSAFHCYNCNIDIITGDVYSMCEIEESEDC